MPKDEKGKIKIRFFEVEVEGGSETLLEGVRTAAAVAAKGSPVKVIRALPSTPAAPENVDHEPDLFDGDGTGDEVESESAGPAKAKKNRTYTNPEILEIDLVSGDVPLEAFAASKEPSEMSKRYLVVAAWLKGHREITEIGIDHIWTCFRFLQWSVPRDIGQPFRKAKAQGWFRASGRGVFEITHVGLEVVRKLKLAA